MTELTASITRETDYTAIHISGYLSSDAEALEAAFAEAGDTYLVLIFDEKCFINSAGLAVLFDLILPLQEQGKQVRIAEPAAHFRKVFDIVGLSKDVVVYEGEGAAVSGW